MSVKERIEKLKRAHEVLASFDFEVVPLERGYAGRWLRIDVGTREISIHPVDETMKKLWTGGKGFDLWMTFQEIDGSTKWNSPNNPICFSSGPLGGTVSFPGSGKTLVTTVSPLTDMMIDCNVGGYFGPFLKFAGFDALMVTGKSDEELIVFIDAVAGRVTIERAPLESVDSHLVAEELSAMYADDEFDLRNIACVSAGRGAQHTRLGILNFSFWDWRRAAPRLKQAGRGGVGTVFRDKNLKALVIKNNQVTPAWRIEQSPAALALAPKKAPVQDCPKEIDEIGAIIERWERDPERVLEMLQDIQERFRYVSSTAIDEINRLTGSPKSRLYHIATFYDAFSLEPKGGDGIIGEIETNKNPVPPGGAGGGRDEGQAAGAAKTGPAGDAARDAGGDTWKETPEGIRFFTRGEPVVLRNMGRIDPEKIEDYIQGGGYEALRKVLSLQPRQIVEEVVASGLRGRGGDGFPTGLKWRAGIEAAGADGGPIYIACNADEGAPGAFAARAILESDPHAVIEGMLIGARAVGAADGFIYIRKDYQPALSRLLRAISQARAQGLLGDDIAGSGFSCNIHVRRGGGALVSGESSAVMAALGGRAGEPHPKYIHGAEAGYRGRPTVLNNAETWANIPAIVSRGAAWFAALGTAGAAGTKVFSLAGDIANTGLVEAPLGTPLGEIVGQIGGGAPAGRKLKALQTGGPAGGCLPAARFDLGADFDSLAAAGSMLGSGGISVMNEGACMVDTARRSIDFLSNESCGKCTACREGLHLVGAVLGRICKGEGRAGDIERLEELCETVRETSLCGFGASAPNPVASTLKHFRDEYEEHIRDGKCRAGVCEVI